MSHICEIEKNNKCALLKQNAHMLVCLFIYLMYVSLKTKTLNK